MLLVRLLSTAAAVSLLAGTSRALGADDPAGLTVAGTVTDVTVYRGQALVTRRVDLGTAGGLREVVVTDLPESILPGSLFAEGDEGAQVRSVTYRARPLAQDAREQVRALEAKIQSARDALAALEALRAVDDAHRANLERLEQFVAPTAQAELKSGVLNAETLTKLINFARDQRGELAERVAQREAKMRDARQALALLERELATLSAGASRTAREAVLFVSAPDRGGSVRLSYLVGNASWQPSYNLRADEAGKAVRVEYQAQVRQMSGEDWSGVRMTLSTATPALVSMGPRLEPMKLALAAGDADEKVRFYRGNAYGEVRRTIQLKQQELAQGRNVLAATTPGREDDREAYAQADKSLNENARDSQLLDLVTSEHLERKALGPRNQPASGGDPADPASITVTYVLPSQTSLPSRSDQQLIQIASGDVPAAFVRVATPVLSEYVFVEADVTNALAANGRGLVLLSGPINAYLAGQFVGRGVLPTVSAGETFTAGFGIDSSLRARRELVERTDTVQGGNRVAEFTYRLMIENFSGSPASVRVLDRMPQGAGSELKITLAPLPSDAPLSIDPAYLKNERKQGILRWDLTVPASASGLSARAFEYSFKLEHDKQMTLGGMGG